MFHEKIFENTGKFYFGSIAGPKTLLKKIYIQKKLYSVSFNFIYYFNFRQKKNINFSLKT